MSPWRWPTLSGVLTLACAGLALLLSRGYLAPGSAEASASAAQAPRSLTVLAGAGQDTVAVDAFFPQNVRIRAGDSVTWRIESDQSHNVGFTRGATPPGPLLPDMFGAPGEVIPAVNIPVPGRPGFTMLNPVREFPNVESGATYSGNAYITSGRLAKGGQIYGVPVLDSFTLTFDTPGTYPYLCLLHAGSMVGTVEVAERSSSVPDQTEIDAAAQAEMSLLLARVDEARAQAANPRNQPGPNGTRTWFVRAGNTDQGVADRRVTILEFLPQDLRITAGDTVVWSTSFILHDVTFNPSPPPPTWILAEERPDGPPWLIRNPVLVDPVTPAGVYDPAQHFSSGVLNPLAPRGIAWALTLETPGAFEYVCAVHHELGMKGTITVLPRAP